MSDNAQMEKLAEAAATFEREVYAPVFAEKCAELGVPLADEESLQAALETMRCIKGAAMQQSDSLAKMAHSDLQAALGLERPEEAAADAEMVEKAAEDAKQERLQAAFKALTGAAATQTAE